MSSHFHLVNSECKSLHLVTDTWKHRTRQHTRRWWRGPFMHIHTHQSLRGVLNNVWGRWGPFGRWLFTASGHRRRVCKAQIQIMKTDLCVPYRRVALAFLCLCLFSSFHTQRWAEAGLKLPAPVNHRIGFQCKWCTSTVSALMCARAR